MFLSNASRLVGGPFPSTVALNLRGFIERHFTTPTADKRRLHGQGYLAPAKRYPCMANRVFQSSKLADFDAARQVRERSADSFVCVFPARIGSPRGQGRPCS